MPASAFGSVRALWTAWCFWCHLLFWLSLIPFVTGWMGENQFSSWPVFCYGVILLCAAVAYYILTRVLIAAHGKDSLLAQAVGLDMKGIISIVLYVLGLLCAMTNPLFSCLFYVMVAVMWLAPDRRIERTLNGHSSSHSTLV